MDGWRLYARHGCDKNAKARFIEDLILSYGFIQLNPKIRGPANLAGAWPAQPVPASLTPARRAPLTGLPLCVCAPRTYDAGRERKKKKREGREPRLKQDHTFGGARSQAGVAAGGWRGENVRTGRKEW